MAGFFRRNEKLLVPIFMSALMVVFLISLAPSTFNSRSTSDPVVATLGGKDVYQSQLQVAHQEWAILREVGWINPSNSQQQEISVAEALFGRAAASIAQNPDAFFLLVRKAEQAQIVVDPDEVQSALKNNLTNVPPELLDSDRLTQAIADALRVKLLGDQELSMVKITAPMRDYVLATGYQNLVVDVANFPASGYLSQVPAPTDADIRNQYDSFKDNLAGQYGSKRDPLGLGYKVPDRVKIQYLQVRDSDLEQAARTSRSEQDWYNAAYGEFAAHRDEFDAQEVEVPTTEPSRGASAKQPATHLAVRKIEPIDQDFALHANVVLEELYAQQAEQIRNDVVKQLTQSLSSGYGAWRDAHPGATTQFSPATSPSADDYASIDYLRQLALTVQAQYHVLPVTADIDQFKDVQQLNSLGDIGQAKLYYSLQAPPISFGDYAITLLQPFMDASLKQSPLASIGLSPLEPSKPIRDAAQDVFIFRVSDLDPAHAPPLDKVKEQVASDWKLSAAYDKASAAAHGILDDARRQGLQSAAASAKVSVVRTEPFDPAIVLTSSAPSIPPLQLKMDSTRRLADACKQLLVAPPDPSEHAVALADLYPDAIAAVVQLESAKANWTPQTLGALQAEISMGVRQQDVQSLRAALCDYNTLAQEMDYSVKENARSRS